MNDNPGKPFKPAAEDELTTYTAATASAQSATRRAEVRDRLGRYKIISLLGRGGVSVPFTSAWTRNSADKSR